VDSNTIDTLPTLHTSKTTFVTTNSVATALVARSTMSPIQVRWLLPLAAVLCALLTIERAWSRDHATSSVTAVLPLPGHRTSPLKTFMFG